MDKLYPEPPMPRDRRGNAMPWLQEKKEVTVSADASSNSLIIDAPVERRESLERLAETLDRVEVAPVAQLRTYRIVGADPTAVSRMLQGLARQGTLSGPAQNGKQKVDVVIEVEPRSSTLIVAGDAVTFEKVEQVLQDLTAVPVERGLRIVPIANARAGDVGDRASAIYESQVRQIPGAGEVDLSVDEETNSLEVVADREAMDRFMRILSELQEQVGPAREVRLIELRLAKADDVVVFLRELSGASESLRADGGPEPVFEVIEATNAIMVAAQPSQFRIIEPLIRSLDNRQTADRPPLRILRLRSTDAAGIAQVLQRSYSRRSPEDRALRPVDIEADPATNTLIISAHEEVLPEIESIIRDLNESQAYDSEGREIRVFPLRVARAEELARTMDQMYPEPPMPVDSRGRPLPHLQGRKEVFVRADTVTNSLIVDAPANRLNGFERLVESLDTLNVGEDVEVRTYRVTRADANAVAQAITRLAGSGALAAAGRTAVTVTVEPSTRAIVVSGPAGSFGQIESLVRDLDGPIERATTVMRLYSLSHARADRLAETVRRVLSARLREQRAIGAASVPVGLDAEVLEVAADAASNTLIINATEELQEVAQRLIEALDTEAAEIGRATVRVVPLTFAEATDVARTVTQSLPTMDLPSGEPALVRIVAAAASNALVLSGPTRDLDKVQELVEPLDRQPFDPEKPSIETFPLEHADASAIAQTVQRLLVDQQQTDPRILMMQLRYTRGRLPDRTPIRVEVEGRTNALIVSGPTETIDLARSVIERLDRPAMDEDRRVLVYTPSRADPVRLAESVRRVAEATIERSRRELEITADVASGTVLVIGDEAQAAEVVALLSDFDERSPAAPSVELRTVALVHADARSVAATVGGMLGDRARWPDELRRASDAGLAIPAPRVSADGATNRVLVSAPAALMGMAESLIAAFDEPRGSGAVDVRVFRLESGNAESVAAALRDSMMAGLGAGETRPSITAETGSNSVVIAADRARLDRAADLIEAMDAVAAEPSEVGVRTLFLRHARADTLAPIVEGVLRKEDPIDRLPWWAQESARLQRVRSGGSEPTSIRVQSEPRLNALVVSAPAPILELAEDVVAELDADPAAMGNGRSVRVLTLVNADASELAGSIEAVFSDDPSVTVPPTVRVDAASNSLIVSATADQMTLVERLTSDLDRATLRSSRQMRTIPIDRSRADAEDVARTLRRLLEQRGGVRVKVIGLDELMSDDEGEAAQPVGPSGAVPAGLLDGGAIGVVRAGVLWSVLAQSTDVDSDDEADEITIAVDRATNTLVVVGSPRATDRLAELAGEVQSQIPAEPTQVRFIELPASADARQVAGLISQTVRQVGRVSERNPGGFTGPVAVTPDTNAGVLVVWANDTDFESIGELIRGVARLEKAQRVTIKVYPLTNTDARTAAQTVGDLFAAAPRGRQAQRLRGAEIELLGDGGTVRGRIDPRDVTVSASPTGGQLIVSAPADAVEIIDRFVAMIDQSPVAERMEIRRYGVESADAVEMSRTLQRLLDAKRQGPGVRGVPRAVLVAEPRTNSVLVTATGEQHAEIEGLILAADVSLEADDERELAVIPLEHSRPSVVARVIDEVVIGRDPAKAERVRVTAQDDSGVLIVRAGETELAEVRELVSQVDVQEASAYPVRSIKLERADATNVARELQRFFQQRGSVGRGGRGGRGGGAAIVGDRRSGTLVIAASDEDYEQISALAAQFDAPSAEALQQYRIIPLKHIQASSVQNTLEDIGWRLTWGRNRSGQNARTDEVIAEVDTTTNSVILFGSGEVFEVFENIIAELDQPRDLDGSRVVRAVPVPKGDLRALERLIERTTATPDWYFWQGADPGQVQVEADTARRLLILIGTPEKVDLAAKQLEQIAEAAAGEGQVIETIALQHAQAPRAAVSLQRFFRERAQAEGRNARSVSILGSVEGNTLIVAAPPADMALLKDLVGQIDQPELGEGRRIEVYTFANADPREVANTLRAMFPRRGPIEDQVIVTPQPSRGAVIVSAPEDEFGRIAALVEELDRIDGGASSRMVTVQLETARAGEVASALRSALPDAVNVSITPVERSNSILVTGSDDAVSLVLDQIATLDTPVTRSPVEFRRFELEHADASDTVFSLRQLTRNRPRSRNDAVPSLDAAIGGNVISVTASSDEMAFIESMIRELDVPQVSDRRTEFVKLRFADAAQVADALRMFYGPLAREATTQAEREVTFVADPASNSLVISADVGLFEDIRALIARLDTEEYDTSRQLVVIPLRHADATSVARALNEGFQAPLEAELQRERVRVEAEQRRNRGRDDGQFFQPSVLVSDEETPSVSAEVQTNSLVVFAGRKELDRIRAIVEQLDTPDFLQLPEARLIPVTSGVRASAVAQSIRSVFLNAQIREGSPRRPVIVGDDASSTLIVRADDSDFGEIRALARSLIDQSASTDVSPRVIRLRSLNASRMRDTLLRTLRPIAQRRNEAFAVEADLGTNTLIVSASAAIFGQAVQLVRELENEERGGDAEIDPRDGVGDVSALGGLTVVLELVHTAPVEMVRLLDELGVTRGPRADETALVTQAVSVVALEARSAIAITAAESDVDVVRDLVRLLDAEPGAAVQSAAVVPLRLADARTLVPLLDSMLRARPADGKSAPAEALAEQIRRLRVDTGRFDREPLELDLSVPIRLIADTQGNAVVIASSPANVAAMTSVVELFDQLPLGDAVVVRLFPLDNASASRVKRVIDELFRAGEALRRLPGTDRRGLPTTTTGQALAGEVTVSVDERTNTLIIAGREEAVALAEVIITDLDRDGGERGWIEAEVIPLKFADAVRMADLLDEVLVDGIGETPDAAGLQEQVGRLRVIARGGDVSDALASDLFAPLTDLVLTPEPSLNAVIAVGTRSNLDVVNALIELLDVEQAAASNSVRVFPLQHASADRVGAMVEDVFAGRERLPDARPEDRLSISVDLRTNALVVSTSRKSFEVLEGLIETLDQPEAKYSVGLHVIPVPGADVDELAPKINRLMRERIQAARGRGGVAGPADAFSIEPVPASDLLIVAASDENLELVNELIAVLAAGGEAAGDGQVLELVPVEGAGNAASIADAVNELYVTRENDKRGRGAVAVFPSDRQNALIVSGTVADVDAVRALVAQLGNAEVDALQEVKRVSLRAANAFEIVRLVEGLLAGRSISGARGGNELQATRIRFYREAIARAAGAEAETEEAIEATIDPPSASGSV
jgi:type II secretory pathway component GspD/PulD (secretin)